MQITRTAQADRTSPDFWVLLNRAFTLADRGIPDDAGSGGYGDWHMNSSHFALSAARTARLAVDALAAVADPTPRMELMMSDATRGIELLEGFAAAHANADALPSKPQVLDTYMRCVEALFLAVNRA